MGVDSCKKILRGKMSAEGVLIGKISAGSNKDYKNYSGSYEVTPTTKGQVLETYDKHMEDDITINPIPYYEVSNEQLGQTVIIGG